MHTSIIWLNYLRLGLHLQPIQVEIKSDWSTQSLLFSIFLWFLAGKSVFNQDFLCISALGCYLDLDPDLPGPETRLGGWDCNGTHNAAVMSELQLVMGSVSIPRRTEHRGGAGPTVSMAFAHLDAEIAVKTPLFQNVTKRNTEKRKNPVKMYYHLICTPNVYKIKTKSTFALSHSRSDSASILLLSYWKWK